MDDKQIEDEINAKGLNAPRVTPADIEENIKGEYYFTAGEGCRGENPHADWGGEDAYHESLDLLTFCVLTLRNGFTVTGESACASPENFDPELGRKIARQNAVNKMWPLMGYALKERLAMDEDKACAVVDTRSVGFSFGEAIEFVKQGKQVARAGWNGKGMSLYLLEGAVPMSMAHLNQMEPCIVMITAQGKHQPGWLASQADMLATDWQIV